MKRKLVLFLVVAVTGLLTFGCAEEEKEVYVPSFEAMGCSATFADTNLNINPDISGGSTHMAIYGMNCNSQTGVSVEFFDDTIGGDREAFFVNGQNEAYVVGLNPYEEHKFTFTAKDIRGEFMYYGKYRVVALNMETNEYTYKDYYITAKNNSIYGKKDIQAAPAKGELKTMPEFSTDALIPLKNNEETAKKINAQLDEAAKNLDSSAVAK